MQRDEVMTVLDDPVAQELLDSAFPARIAYIGTDGAPRAVPVGFLWNGSEIVVHRLQSPEGASDPGQPQTCLDNRHPGPAPPCS